MKQIEDTAIGGRIGVGVEFCRGNIRNIALAAAFLGARHGGVVTMAHRFHVTRREYQKMGRVVTEGECESFAGADRC